MEHTVICSTKKSDVSSGFLSCYYIKPAISERIWGCFSGSSGTREVQPILPRWSAGKAGPNICTHENIPPLIYF